MTQYRTIPTTTIQGLKTAEQLQANGWRIIRSGMFSVQMEKRTPAKVRK